MKRFIFSLLLLVILAGCGGPRRELNARMVEMISFIDVVKEKEGFLALYFDPRTVRKEKESKNWARMVKAIPEEVLSMTRAQLVAAQEKTPKFSYKGSIATYTLDDQPEISFIKFDGQWYLYYGKK